MTGGVVIRGALGLLLAALAACTSSGSAPSPGDVAFARGDYEAAAVAYRAESAGGTDNMPAARRLRFALALAAPEHPGSDRVLARTILDDLRSDAVFGGQATAILVLVEHLTGSEIERRRLAAGVGELRAEVDRCSAENARLREADLHGRAEVEHLVVECEELRARVAALEEALAERDAELAELRAMIEDLKHVDLGPGS